MRVIEVKNLHGRGVVELKKKVCMFGDPAVGKTSLIRRYVLNAYDDSYLSTMEAKVSKKVCTVRLPNYPHTFKVNLQIWDVMGQYEHRNFHKAYLMGAESVILVADITRRQTFNSMTESLFLIWNAAGRIPVILAFNKADLMQYAQIKKSEMDSFAHRYRLPYVLTSAKTGLNVETSFQTISSMMVRRHLMRKR